MTTDKTLSKTGTYLYEAALILFLIQGVLRDTLLVSSSITNQYLLIIYFLYFLSIGLLTVKVLFFQDIFHSHIIHSAYFWIFSILLAVSTLISRNPAIFSVWLFGIAYKDTDFDSSVRIALVTEISIVFAVALLSIAGILPSETYPPTVGHPFTRYSFGFLHPNSLGLYSFHIGCCFYYLRRKKSVIFPFLILIGISIFNYFVTSSRTSVICSILLMLCLLIFSFITKEKTINEKKKIQIFSLSLISFSALAMIFSLLFSFFYDYSLVQKIDTLFSGRFFYISTVLSSNQISWLGKAPFSIGGPFDNSYMWILLHYGILIYIFVSALYIHLLIRLHKRKQYLEVIFLFVYSCYAMMESEIFVANKCIFVLLFGLLFWKQREQQNLQK